MIVTIVVVLLVVCAIVLIAGSSKIKSEIKETVNHAKDEMQTETSNFIKSVESDESVASDAATNIVSSVEKKVDTVAVKVTETKVDVKNEASEITSDVKADESKVINEAKAAVIKKVKEAKSNVPKKVKEAKVTEEKIATVSEEKASDALDSLSNLVSPDKNKPFAKLSNAPAKDQPLQDTTKKTSSKKKK